MSESGSDAKNVDISGSTGVFVGDGNTANITINNYGPKQAPALGQLQTNEIALDLAASYFDRKDISLNLDDEFARSPLSVALLVGQEDDWHDGLWQRLSREYELKTPDGQCSAEIEWPSSDDKERSWFALWQRACDQFGIEQLGADVNRYKASLSQFLVETNRQRSATQIVIRYRFSSLTLSPFRTELLRDLVDEWGDIHTAIQDKSKGLVHIALLVTVVEPTNASGKLKSLFGLQGDTGEYTRQRIAPVVPEALIEVLPLVAEIDIDDWVKTLRVYFEKDFSSDSWWRDLKKHMERQFKKNKKGLRHRLLREQLEDDEQFCTALKYKG